MPYHWSIKRLKHVARRIVDGAHFTPTYVDAGVPFLRVTDIHSKTIDWTNVKRIPESEHKELTRRCKPGRGDVLLSKNGTIGIPFVVDFDDEFSIFVSLCLIKLRPELNPYFLEFLFRSNLFTEQLELSSKKNTVTNLHLDKIENLIVPLPPLNEQIEIVNFLNEQVREVDGLIDRTLASISTLTERRSALITVAVTGRYDVTLGVEQAA